MFYIFFIGSLEVPAAER